MISSVWLKDYQCRTQRYVSVRHAVRHVRSCDVREERFIYTHEEVNAQPALRADLRSEEKSAIVFTNQNSYQVHRHFIVRYTADLIYAPHFVPPSIDFYAPSHRFENKKFDCLFEKC